MKQRICDLCKKPIEYSRIMNNLCVKGYHVVIKKHILERIVGGFITRNEKLDICPECMDKMVNYILKNKEK